MPVGKLLDSGWRVSIVPNMRAELAPPGSDLHREALRLQALRFGSTVRRDGASDGSKTASGSRESAGTREPGGIGGTAGTGEAYMATTDYAPESTIPVVVRSTVHAGSSAPFGIVGVARLELPGSTLIEATMRLRPGSAPAQALADGRATEIGGFATPVDVDRITLLDVVDTLVAAFLDLAEPLGLDWFWLFPRVGFMTLMWAMIPGALPPYRFTLSPDVLGWNEGNQRLAQLRALQPRGLQDFPELYHVERATLREDLQRRLALRSRRIQLGAAMSDALFGAMRQANRLLPQHAHTTALAQRGPEWHAIAAIDTAGDAGDRSAGANQTIPQPNRPVQTQGVEHALALNGLGEALPMYKEKAYRLLALEPGVQVLDVACGVGTDLRALAVGTGSTGRVIGLERDPELVHAARERLRQMESLSGSSGIPRTALAPCVVFQGDCEHLTFPGALFDRVRIDCALQRFRRPDRALRELWRVLCPNGILSLVEPDWVALNLQLGRGAEPATNGVAKRDDIDDEVVLHRLLAWYRTRLPHASIGRQLSALLLTIGPDAWKDIGAERRVFVISDWLVVERMLQVTEAAKALAEEQPALSQMIDRWLRRLTHADASRTFRALLPLYFVTARKALSGRRAD